MCKIFDYSVDPAVLVEIDDSAEPMASKNSPKQRARTRLRSISGTGLRLEGVSYLKWKMASAN